MVGVTRPEATQAVAALPQSPATIFAETSLRLSHVTAEKLHDKAVRVRARGFVAVADTMDAVVESETTNARRPT